MTQRDEDAVWRSIVENYGDRVQLDEPDLPPDPEPLIVPQATSPERDAEPEPEPDPGDHFVPPEPPPFALPEPPRLIAWTGVLGVPVAAVLLAVLQVAVPPWAGAMGLAWFVGGFAYLVATMPRHHGGDGRDGDDWDDGAVL